MSKKKPLGKGDLVITVSLLFPNHQRGGAPRQFDLVCNPETMRVALEEDLVSLTEEFDPNEDKTAAARAVCEALEKEGINMNGMEYHVGNLLMAVIEATP